MLAFRMQTRLRTSKITYSVEFAFKWSQRIGSQFSASSVKTNFFAQLALTVGNYRKIHVLIVMSMSTST